MAVAFPIPNQTQLQTGPIDQGVYSSVEEIDGDFLPFWLENVSSHNAEMQKIFLQEDSLKTYFSTKPPVGHEYISTPFIAYSDPDDEDEEMEDEVTTLSADCNMVTEADTFDTLQRELNILSPRGATTVSPNRRGSRLLGGTIDTDELFQAEASDRLTATDKAQYNARIQAYGAHYDSGTKKVTLPELSQFVALARDQTSKTTQREDAI